MDYKFIKKGIATAALIGTILAPTAQVLAAEAVSIFTIPEKNNVVNAVAEINKNTNSKKTIKVESEAESKLNEALSEKSFAEVGEEGYLSVNVEADENSEFTGKIYESSVVDVVEKTEEWTEIASGNVVGFIKTENLISGKEAIVKAKEILKEQFPETDITTLNKEQMDVCFSVGETVEEEATRVAAEESARIEAERLAREAAVKEQGQAVVDYAKQFIGNPYVYGGTSLTRGTDCSGFVRGVYAHFGISLPRTSYSMRSVGHAVSFDEMMPGDIVCYAGHVGIYAGDGQIVNAINESRGIGMSSVRYKNIISIRRVY